MLSSMSRIPLGYDNFKLWTIGQHFVDVTFTLTAVVQYFMTLS